MTHSEAGAAVVVREGVLEFDYDDGGAYAAAILYPEPIPGVDPDRNDRVRIVIAAYDERAWRDPSAAHASVRRLSGRRVRVTLEVLDDADAG